jgi:hypothetical protein
MVFKFSKSDDSLNQQLNRKIKKLDTFNNKVVFINGFNASGKTMLSPIISSINNAESIIFPYEIEWMGSLLYSNDVSKHAFQEFIKQYCDHTIYNQMMSRNTNFRKGDISSVLNTKDFIKYFSRLFKKGDNYLPKIIEEKKPIINFTTTHLTFFIEEILESLSGRCLFIETVRDPVYMFEQIKILFKEVYINNPKKFFTYVLESNDEKSLFFDFYSNKDELINFNNIQNINKICVDYLERIYNFYFNLDFEKINTHNSKLILLPFEKFVINPDNWINEILNFLEQKYSKNLKQELKNQNVPRKILNQGFKRKVYERYGNKIIKNNKAENMSYEEADLNYREYIKKTFEEENRESFEKLLYVSTKYQTWIKNFKNFSFN